MEHESHSHTAHRVGGWLPAKREAMNEWLAGLISELEEQSQKNQAVVPLHPVMKEFKAMIESDPVIYMYFTQMFEQVPNRGKFKTDPIGGPQVRTYDQMLQLINLVLTKAPEFNTTDLVGFPINAILDWAMGTPAGFSAFVNEKVNAMFKKVLNVWCNYLSSSASLYVLNTTSKGWMCPEAIKKIGIDQYVYDPKDEHWGFKSWNNFFIREFKDGARPVAEPNNSKVIVSACESTPFCISNNVQKRSQFWIKSQPYSLEYMFDNDPLVEQFVGGTVYQAFLSAYNYHRWHSPISGTIKKAYVKDGTYYSEAQSEHFDPAGPNLSQGYITQVAARAIIFIEADDKDIGLVGFLAVGMAEVSSNIITVKEGQKVKKGEQLGYFQFGGSTHCLVFRKGVISEFSINALPSPEAGVVKLHSKIATAN